MMETVDCGRIWGGNKNTDLDMCTATLETSVRSIASDSCNGGDFYFYSVCGEGTLSRIILGDVVGHGDEVSHISRWVYDLLKKNINKLAGNNILSSLNNEIHKRGLDAMTTAAVIAYYTGDHNFYFSYAGHYPALIRRKDEDEWWPAYIDSDSDSDSDIPNIPLGIKKNIPYDQCHIPLSSGDCVFIYTDGIIEATDENDQMYNIERLVACLDDISENDPQILKNAVFDDVEKFCNGQMEHDDVTAIVIKIH